MSIENEILIAALRSEVVSLRKAVNELALHILEGKARDDLIREPANPDAVFPPAEFPDAPWAKIDQVERDPTNPFAPRVVVASRPLQ